MKSIKTSLLAIMIFGLFFSQMNYAQMGGMGGGGSMRRGGWNNNKTNSNSNQESIAPDKTLGDIQLNLSKIENELNLNTQQVVYWQDLLNEIQNYYNNKKKLPITISGNKSTGMRYIQSKVDQASNRYTIMQNIEDKSKKLYEILNESQKTVFDQKIMLVIPL